MPCRSSHVDFMDELFFTVVFDAGNVGGPSADLDVGVGISSIAG